jgi:hypothetical protein
LLEYIEKTIVTLTPDLRKNPKYQIKNLSQLKIFEFSTTTLDDEAPISEQEEYLFNTLIVNA